MSSAPFLHPGKFSVSDDEKIALLKLKPAILKMLSDWEQEIIARIESGYVDVSKFGDVEVTEIFGKTKTLKFRS